PCATSTITAPAESNPTPSTLPPTSLLPPTTPPTTSLPLSLSRLKPEVRVFETLKLPLRTHHPALRTQHSALRTLSPLPRKTNPPNLLFPIPNRKSPHRRHFINTRIYFPLMRITVKLFAILRDRAGTAELALELREGEPAAAAGDQL